MEGSAMPTVHVPTQLDVEHLMAAVKQLSPVELQEFTQQFAAWQQQNGPQSAEEAALAACIGKNSRLPTAEQRRFNRLRRKRQAETLTKAEEADLQSLWQQVERMNVARLEALTRMAQLHGTDVKTCMRDLGLKEYPDVV
jgi:hypothetical protein